MCTSSFASHAPRSSLAKRRLGSLSAGLALWAAACTRAPTPIADSTEPLPDDTVPCARLDAWPHALRSEARPITVRFRRADERDAATEALGQLERSWTLLVDELGLTAPLLDGGRCGDDDRFDAFVWRGREQTWVDVLDANAATEWDDYFSYLVLDPWGPYGGELAAVTAGHELVHASQAADDWWDVPAVFEMTAAFLEAELDPTRDDWVDYFEDFQAHPEWALDYDDRYETWHMYGSSMFLFFLRDRYFAGDPRFVGEMWRRMRNPPGADVDRTANEPDFVDALDALLVERAGVTTLETLPELVRWRWYTGDRADAAHWRQESSFAKAARPASTSAALDGRPVLVRAPMMLGTAYVDVVAAGGQADFGLTVGAQGSERLIVQALPGLDGSDGELLDATRADGRVRLTPEGTRTIAVTVVPAEPALYDPDTRSDAPVELTLILSP
ncbi:MAG: hypothetical protein L6Q95_02910 [Planctomycetes bacterium]|nr:hypothetical protein [Planctomycetota bacterium]